jgi:two-component system, sensor histidine kinase
MRSYRDFPIRTKLQAIIVVTSGIALMAASAGLSFYARATLLRAKTQELYTAAKMVGSNSTAALTFRDQQAAEAILGALRVNANVVVACTYDGEGKVFATYSRGDPGVKCPDSAQPEGESEIVNGHIVLFQTISLRGQTIGTIYLESDLKDLNRLVFRFLGIVLLVLAGSMAIALALASVLQRIISEPIRQLAATALSIDKYRDYSIRAEKFGDDEVGALFDAFNRMLEHIHERDIALQNAHNEMERRVEERTAHLNALMEDNKKMEIELRHALKLEAVGALAAGIAHEINTPIQFVSDNTRFLRDAFVGIASVMAKYEKIGEEALEGILNKQSLEDAAAERDKADWEYLAMRFPRPSNKPKRASVAWQALFEL